MTATEFKNRIATAYKQNQDVSVLLYWINKEGAY